MIHITPKEKEIIEMLALGLSTKQIAAALSISPHTVESHRKNLRVKFEARNSSELMTKILQFALSPPGSVQSAAEGGD